MMRISLGLLITIYLMAFVIVVAGLWISIEWRRGARRKKARRDLVKCQICGLEFIDRSAALLPRCQRCGSLNERIRPSDL